MGTKAETLVQIFYAEGPLQDLKNKGRPKFYAEGPLQDLKKRLLRISTNKRPIAFPGISGKMKHVAVF